MWLSNLISSTSIQQTKFSIETFVQQHKDDIDAAIQSGDSADYIDYVYHEHLGSGIHVALSEIGSQKQLSGDIINQLLYDIISAKLSFKKENKTLEMEACQLLAYELAYQNMEMQDITQGIPQTIDESKKLIKTIKEQIIKDEEKKKNLAILVTLQDVLGKAMTRIVDRINALGKELDGPFSTSNEINSLVRLMNDIKSNNKKQGNDIKTETISFTSLLKNVNTTIKEISETGKEFSASYIQEMQNDFNKLIKQVESKQNGNDDFIPSLVAILKSKDKGLRSQEATSELNLTETKEEKNSPTSVKPNTSNKGIWGGFITVFKGRQDTTTQGNIAPTTRHSQKNKFG